LCVPSLLSYLAFHTPDAEIKGLKDFPKDDRPPVMPTFVSFRLMLALGFAMLFMTIMGVVYAKRGTLESHSLFLKLMLFAIPLPYIAGQLGWIVAEVGRQPWIVYGVLKTTHAVSQSISTGQVIASLLGFTLLYGGLGVVDIYLLSKFAKKGPAAYGAAAIAVPAGTDGGTVPALQPLKEEEA
ncbi:MAG: cytochrome ubiquinol oxidase subunit I, partial [Betaproteobacteria bacterium]